jgi:hypothetical protein
VSIAADDQSWGHVGVAALERARPRELGPETDSVEAWTAYDRREAAREQRERRLAKRLDAAVRVLLAGPAAEARYRGVSCDEMLREQSSSDDRHKAIDAAVELLERQDLEEFMRRAIGDAVALVQTHWTAVQAVASALLLEETMSARRVRQLVDRIERAEPNV